MKLLLTTCIFFYFIVLNNASPAPAPATTDDMKKILVKAFEIYKEIEDIDREEEYKIRGAIADAPLNYWVESAPDNESNDSDENDEGGNSEFKKTLIQIGWKIAKMLMKKFIAMLG